MTANRKSESISLPLSVADPDVAAAIDDDPDWHPQHMPIIVTVVPTKSTATDGEDAIGLEIENTSIPPPCSFLLLDGKKITYHFVSLLINFTLYTFPFLLHSFHVINSFAVSETQLIPKCFTGFNFVIPGQVMKPK